MWEFWRPIPGMSYEASSLGRVRNAKRQRIVRPCRATNGRLYIGVYLDDRRRNYFVHQLVCMAFHGEKPFPGAQVRHMDGQHLNNVPSNLRWGTDAENKADDVRLGIRKGDRHHLAKLTTDDVLNIKGLLAQGIPGAAIARRYHMSRCHISAIKTGRSWAHLGGA